MGLSLKAMLLVLFVPAVLMFLIDAYGVLVYGFNSIEYYTYRYYIVIWLMMILSVILIPISIKLYEREHLLLEDVLGFLDRSRFLEILILLFITITVFALQEYLTSTILFKRVEDYGRLLRSLYDGFPLILRYVYALVYPVIISIGEEMFFRGYGVKVLGLKNTRYSYLMSSIAYSLWYGVGMPFYSLGAFIIGLIYAFFYIRRRLSLKSIILAHYLALLIGCLSAL